MAINKYSSFLIHKNSGRSRHINSYVHKIIQFIKKHARPLTFDEVEKNTNIKLLENRRLLNTLSRNSKVIIKNDTILFKPVYSVKNEQDLEKIMIETNCEYGIEVEMLLDSPIDIRPFIENLKKKDVVYVLKDMYDSEIIFYNKLQLPFVNKTILEMYNKIKIPSHQDILNDLSLAGIKTEDKSNEERKNIVVKKSKIKKCKRKIQITDAHVKGLNINNSE